MDITDPPTRLMNVNVNINVNCRGYVGMMFVDIFGAEYYCKYVSWQISNSIPACLPPSITRLNLSDDF